MRFPFALARYRQASHQYYGHGENLGQEARQNAVWVLESGL
jgi:hypothetical protein